MRVTDCEEEYLLYQYSRFSFSDEERTMNKVIFHVSRSAHTWGPSSANLTVAFTAFLTTTRFIFLLRYAVSSFSSLCRLLLLLIIWFGL